MMNATNILALGGIAAMLTLSACDSDKSVADADKEAKLALEKHSEKIDQAKQERTDAAKREAIDEANQELGADMEAAYKGVEPEPQPGDLAATPRDADADAVSPDQRFSLIDEETEQEFATRANATLRALDADLAEVKRSDAPAEEVEGVEAKLAEARKDLDEVTTGTSKMIDDGKAGVTVAINSARRKLERIQNDLTDKPKG